MRPSADSTWTSRYEKTEDCNFRSVGVIGDKKVTTIFTLPPTSNLKMLLVDVYSSDVCLAFSTPEFGIRVSHRTYAKADMRMAENGREAGKDRERSWKRD
jgi:hypothetical protein